MCKIVHISDSMVVKDKPVKVDSLLAYKQPANFTCNDKNDTAICANAGENISLYCDKGMKRGYFGEAKFSSVYSSDCVYTF